MFPSFETPPIPDREEKEQKKVESFPQPFEIIEKVKRKNEIRETIKDEERNINAIKEKIVKGKEEIKKLKQEIKQKQEDLRKLAKEKKEAKGRIKIRKEEMREIKKYENLMKKKLDEYVKEKSLTSKEKAIIFKQVPREKVYLLLFSEINGELPREQAVAILQNDIIQIIKEKIGTERKSKIGKILENLSPVTLMILLDFFMVSRDSLEGKMQEHEIESTLKNIFRKDEKSTEKAKNAIIGRKEIEDKRIRKKLEQYKEKTLYAIEFIKQKLKTSEVEKTKE